MTGKRAFDLCMGVLALLLSLPLLALVAVAIRHDSDGPVLLRHPRIGRRGRCFLLYRFRSTVSSSDTPIPGAQPASLTRIGRIIRPLRIDDLPQLLNVIRGDMSLVGPRAEMPSVVEEGLPGQDSLLEARPGMTGPAQLTWLEQSPIPDGADPVEYYVQHLVPGRLQMDLRYLRTQSFANDTRTLVTTAVKLWRSVQGRPRLSPFLEGTRLFVDFIAVGVATYLAFFARFDGVLSPSELKTLLRGLPYEAAAYAFAFLYMRTYRSIWRYTGVQDFWQLAKASALGAGLNAVLMHMGGAHYYPRSVLLLTPVFALLLLGGTRLTWRTAATAVASWGATTERRRIVIVGAGRTGASVAREILSSPGLAYDVVGFVDDDRHLQRATLHNLPVLGTTAELDALTQKHQLTEAIIAVPRPTLRDLRRIREACTRAGLVFKTLPSLGQLVSGDGQVRYLRKVDVGELLQREELALQVDKIAAFLKGKRVMVTGAGGSIGSELCRQIVRLGADSLLMVERAENPLFALCAELRTVDSRTKLTAALADIKHILRMAELFTHFRPQVVFHTAAYKHVPMLESHPTEAVLNNIVGTARLAKLAQAHGVESFIFISTDKAVRPNNLMGATKRICELYLMAVDDTPVTETAAGAKSRFRIVRFGNVLGSAGSALPLFQRQIENGGPITITDPEVSRFFMTIEEAVGLVLESTTLDLQSGIAVLDMGNPVKITTLADDFVTALGLPATEVPRQVIGLRPGEKLHEVLWDDVDEVLPSPHSRILVVRPVSRPLKEMEDAVRQLEQLAVEGRVAPLLARVHDLVPSYSGQADEARPWVLQLDSEPRKPLAPSNGDPAARSRIERLA